MTVTIPSKKDMDGARTQVKENSPTKRQVKLSPTRKSKKVALMLAKLQLGMRTPSKSTSTAKVLKSQSLNQRTPTSHMPNTWLSKQLRSLKPSDSRKHAHPTKVPRRTRSGNLPKS